MLARFTAAERRFIAIETGINAVLGSVLPATAMYLTFDPFPMAFWGSDGFAAFLFKNAFGMGAVMTLLMTLAIRARIARARAPRLRWRQADSLLLRLIPRSAFVRAPLFGLAAAVVPGTIAFVVARAVGFGTIDRTAFALAMGGASMLVAVSLTPFILIGAMTDPVPDAGLEPQT